MEDVDDIRKKVEEDFEWLVELFPDIPDIKFLEPNIQSMAIFNAANGINLTNEDLMVIALSGFVASRARVVDDQRFLDIDPHTYLQFSFLLCNGFIFKREINDEDFKLFIARIHINND